MRWGRLAAVLIILVALGLMISTCSSSGAQAPDRPDLLAQPQSAR